MLIRFLENVLLITPMIFLYAKASEHHSILVETIGPNNLEIKSINTIWMLLVGGITMIGASIPLEVIGFLVYNYYGHPWKIFISTDSLIHHRTYADYCSALIENIGKTKHSHSKESSALRTDNNDKKNNLKPDDKSEIRPLDHVTKESKVNEKKISLQTSGEVTALDEVYETLEKQFESCTLLKRWK